MSGHVENVELTERDVSQGPSRASSIASQPLRNANGFQLARADGGKDAWLFVASGTLIDAMAFGWLFSWGVFQEHLASVSQDSAVSIGLVGTIGSAVIYIGTNFYLPFGKRYPERIRLGSAIWLAICVLSIFIASFANALWQLILLLGVGFGSGVTMLYTPLLVFVYEWFSRRRGLAAGLIFAGGGLGGTIFPLLFGRMLESVGFSWTLRIWSFVMAGVCSVALFFLKPRLPYPPKTAPRLPLLPRDLGFLRSPAFYTLVMAILLQAFAFLSVSLYISSYTTELGYSTTAGQVALSIFNIATLIGGILLGWASDRAPFAVVMTFASLFSAIFVFLVLGFASSVALIMLFAALFGAVGGGYASAWPNAAVEMARLSGSDVSQAPTIFTSFGFFKGISAVAGPALAGSLINRDQAGQHALYGSGGYENLIIFVGCSLLASGAMAVVTEVLRKRKTS